MLQQSKKYFYKFAERIGLRKKKRALQFFFTLSIILKGIDGIIEFFGGLIFITLKKQSILNIVSSILHYKLFNIPNATLFKWVNEFSHIFTTDFRIFVSIVLICNGFIKVLISVSLLMKKLVAFPLAVGFLILLLIYQIIQIFYSPSYLLIILTGFDIIVIILIWKEYLFLKKNKKMS